MKELFRQILKLFGVIKQPIAPEISESTSDTDNLAKEELLQQKIEDPVNNYTQSLSYPVLFKALLSKKPTYIENANRTDKGATEDYFLDFAKESLGIKLIDSIRIDVGNYMVTPDLAFIDEEKKIYIVIEIDEPYSISSEGQLIPTHYVGIDDERNKVLMAIGWNVIRFAEIQIMNSTKECIGFINQFIVGKEAQMDCINSWTYEDAINMVQNNFRNSYLPFGFQQKTRTNTGYSYRRFKIDSFKLMTSKKGERFVVVNLIHYYNASAEGIYGCWILEEIFWSTYSKTFIGQIVQREYKDKAKMPLPAGAYFEAVGIEKDDYFNILNSSEFKIVHPERFIAIAKRYSMNRRYMQIVSEYANEYMAEKFKKMFENPPVS